MPPGGTAAVHASHRRRKAAKKARANKAKPDASLLSPRDEVRQCFCLQCWSGVRRTTGKKRAVASCGFSLYSFASFLFLHL